MDDRDGAYLEGTTSHLKSRLEESLKLSELLHNAEEEGAEVYVDDPVDSGTVHALVSHHEPTESMIRLAERFTVNNEMTYKPGKDEYVVDIKETFRY